MIAARPRPGPLAGAGLLRDPRRRLLGRGHAGRAHRLPQARQITFALARADTGLLHTLQLYGIRKRIPDNLHFASLSDAVAAFHAEPPPAVPQARTAPQDKPVAD